MSTKGFDTFLRELCLTSLAGKLFEITVDGSRPPPLIINTIMPTDYYIAKVYRQHNSMVIVIPGAICVAIGLKPGHHVVFVSKLKEGSIQFMKFKPEGAQDERTTKDIDRPDQSGGA